MNSIQSRAHLYRASWALKGNWVEPDLRDALAFNVTEASEALDAELRTRNYVRNNPDKPHTIGSELADNLFMLCVAADALGVDLVDELDKKLKEMDAKRQ